MGCNRLQKYSFVLLNTSAFFATDAVS